jgi:hypothetical protein
MDNITKGYPELQDIKTGKQLSALHLYTIQPEKNGSWKTISYIFKQQYAAR